MSATRVVATSFSIWCYSMVNHKDLPLTVPATPYSSILTPKPICHPYAPRSLKSTNSLLLNSLNRIQDIYLTGCQQISHPSCSIPSLQATLLSHKTVFLKYQFPTTP